MDNSGEIQQKPKLLGQVRDVIQLRHYSRRTEKAYVGWIRRFILFHNKRHPLEMGEAELPRFLSSLAVEAKSCGSAMEDLSMVIRKHMQTRI